MNASNARWEFRAFARNFGIVESRMRALAQLRGIRESAEAYIVSAATEACNIKIRAGALDIKALVGRRQDLEQWAPTVKADLPVPTARVRGWILEPLAAEGASLDQEQYDADALLQLARTLPTLVPAMVFKRRWNFVLGAGLCELAEVSVNGAWTMSACVESEDADLVLRLVRELGLDAYENESYARAIGRVVGLVPAQAVPV